MNLFDTLIIQPIFNLLLGLYSLIPGGDFGIALILFTIIVRFAMWPLLKKQLHQSRAMQKLQPELVRIKKESKGDKQVEGLKMMELYKEHGVSPFRSLGILFIQLPIFIALYQVIQIFTSHRGDIAKFTYDFMKNIGPIKDLIANPDNFNQQLFGIVDLTNKAISQDPFRIDIFILIIVIGSAVTQYIMSRQITPKAQSKRTFKDIMAEAAEGKQADQSEMNAVMMSKMTNFMPIMMFFLMISLPGALALYYTVSNLVAVLQQGSILKKDSQEMIEIADKEPMPGKKATAKARAKQAQEGTVIRIVAKDTAKRK